MARTHADAGLDLHLEIRGTRPARELETALREAIVSGRLPAGDRLPPTRGLAADLGIARATVSDVYAQLIAEGWLESRVGSGTWVAAAPTVSTARAPAARPAPSADAAAPRAGHRELANSTSTGC